VKIPTNLVAFVFKMISIPKIIIPFLLVARVYPYLKFLLPHVFSINPTRKPKRLAPPSLLLKSALFLLSPEMSYFGPWVT